MTARRTDAEQVDTTQFAKVQLAATELGPVLRAGTLNDLILPLDAFLSRADALRCTPVLEVARHHRAHVFVHPGPLPWKHS